MCKIAFRIINAYFFINFCKFSQRIVSNSTGKLFYAYCLRIIIIMGILKDSFFWEAFTRNIISNKYVRIRVEQIRPRRIMARSSYWRAEVSHVAVMLRFRFKDSTVETKQTNKKKNSKNSNDYRNGLSIYAHCKTECRQSSITDRSLNSANVYFAS